MTTRRRLLVLIFAAVATTTFGLAQSYPPHWWEPVSEKEHQWWEIVPQEAAAGEVVLSKRHELGVFSNFAQTPFYFHGKRYESVEGFWYMLAYPEGPDDPRLQNPDVKWPHTRQEVSQMVGFEAKTAGGVAEANMAQLGINWVTFEGRRLKYWSHQRSNHYELIRQILHEKVQQNPRVRELLLSTGDLRLVPDNFDSLRDLPAWRYFDIHREIRDALRSGKEMPPSQRYPAHWWQVVPEADVEGSEVLPQEALPGEVILSRRNELGIFSDLSPRRGAQQEEIVSAIRARLAQDPMLVKLLLSTGDLVLRPDQRRESGSPAVRGIGEIWMALRSELAAQHPRELKVVRSDGSLVDF